MPRFLIERNFADEVEATRDIADNIIRINDEEGVRWLFSFSAPTSGKPTAFMRRRTRRRSASPPGEPTCRRIW